MGKTLVVLLLFFLCIEMYTSTRRRIGSGRRSDKVFPSISQSGDFIAKYKFITDNGIEIRKYQGVNTELPYIAEEAQALLIDEIINTYESNHNSQWFDIEILETEIIL